MNALGLGQYLIIDSHPTNNQTDFAVHLFCSSFLKMDIAEKLSIFWLMLPSLLCFLCFAASIHFTPLFFFPRQSLSSLQSFFFLLFSFQQHFFLLCSDSLFITREIWKKNSRGVFSLPRQRKVADIVGHLSKGRGWAPGVHTLTIPALLFLLLLHAVTLHDFSRQPWCQDSSFPFLNVFYNTFFVSLYSQV